MLVRGRRDSSLRLRPSPSGSILSQSQLKEPSEHLYCLSFSQMHYNICHWPLTLLLPSDSGQLAPGLSTTPGQSSQSSSIFPFSTPCPSS